MRDETQRLERRATSASEHRNLLHCEGRKCRRSAAAQSNLESMPPHSGLEIANLLSQHHVIKEPCLAEILARCLKSGEASKRF